jgi:hypothetical protein
VRSLSRASVGCACIVPESSVDDVPFHLFGNSEVSKGELQLAANLQVPNLESVERDGSVMSRDGVPGFRRDFVTN